MKDFSLEDKCPCGSEIQYKNCCKLLHDGKAASNALELMKSRYCAYAVGAVDYIIQTTDGYKEEDNEKEETMLWRNGLVQFTSDGEFRSLEILDFTEGSTVSYVKFTATIFFKANDESFTENSKFVKRDGVWFYFNA